VTDKPVVFHPEALAEAEAAAAWYADRSKRAAEIFISEIDRAISSIREAPNRWLIYIGGTRRFLLRRFPFSVVYRETADQIQIVAIAHARRRPGYWKGRSQTRS
jgi:toxin ParE1/3/4